MTKEWRELYMTRLRENPDAFSYTRSLTILQELYRETYDDVHGGTFSHTEWQVNVPSVYLSSKGLAAASSWLLRRIGELTYPMSCVD